MPTSQGATTNRQLVLSFFEAINARDYAAFDALVAEDYDDHLAGATRGREALKAYFRGYEPVFPDLRLEVLHIVAEDAMVAVHNSITGTHSAPLGQLAATGRRIRPRLSSSIASPMAALRSTGRSRTTQG